eukprot:UN16271
MMVKVQLANLLQGQSKLRQFCVCSLWIQQNLTKPLKCKRRTPLQTSREHH